MSNKMANTFCDQISLLHTLAENTGGMTAGALQKTMAWNTVGQVKRMLASLEACLFVHTTTEKHGRTGKTVYHMTENAAMHAASIARTYIEKR